MKNCNEVGRPFGRPVNSRLYSLFPLLAAIFFKQSKIVFIFIFIKHLFQRIFGDLSLFFVLFPLARVILSHVMINLSV